MPSSKQDIREQAWQALRQAGAARFPGVEGRIPNFVGAEAAADLLAATPEWQGARTIKANPDSPQLPVRRKALAEGKILYMAVPRLGEPKPFWRLDPDRLDTPHSAASIKGASTYGEPVGLDQMDQIDLVVCGSVAVEPGGARLGKGGGYSDLEFALASEAGLITDLTIVATTVHPSQLVDEGTIPITNHDFPLDIIVTPEEVTYTDTRLPRPSGILWDHLDQERRHAIPVLASRDRGPSP